MSCGRIRAVNEILQIMLWPALACLVLVTIHAYLGLHVLARGVIFVDLALAQMAALGATVAVLMGHEIHGDVAYGIALGFTFLGAGVFAATRMQLRGVPQEAIIGVTYAVASSAAILALNSAPHGAEQIRELMVGSILWVTPAQVIKTAGIYAFVGLFHWRFRKRFMAISFHEDRADTSSCRVKWWDFLFYASFGFVVTSSVKIAGVLLVFTFLIVPSIVGVLFGSDHRSRLLHGWIFGWLVAVLGCVLSYVADLPTGATVVCSFGGALLGAILIWKL